MVMMRRSCLIVRETRCLHSLGTVNKTCVLCDNIISLHQLKYNKELRKIEYGKEQEQNDHRRTELGDSQPVSFV